MDNGRLETWEAVRSYALAGNATFTLRSMKSGERFTYKVVKLKDPEKDVWFVSVLRGADNENDYAYIGVIIAAAFRWSPKSRVGKDAQSFRVFAWFQAQLGGAGPVRADLEVWHTGRCGRCGRKLTVPESVGAGLGPECRLIA